MGTRFSTWLTQNGYWLGGVIGYPVIKAVLLQRKRNGKEDPRRMSERLGKSSAERPSGPLIWLHAASVGETLAIAPLIQNVRSCGIAVLLTTGTVTSAKLAREQFGSSVIHQYVPVDAAPAVSRFLDHWRPDLAINVETEVWPVTIAQLARRRIAHLIVNGRISDRSFDRWMRRRELARSLFSRFSFVMTQTDLDAERFIDLGALNVSVTGNLKVDREAPAADGESLRLLQGEIGDRPVWAAVSTFDGEEQAAGEVHAALKKRHPKLLTVIVPRHPDRAEVIAGLLAAKGLKVVRRSLGEPVADDVDILLGDTIGDMAFTSGLPMSRLSGGLWRPRVGRIRWNRRCLDVPF